MAEPLPEELLDADARLHEVHARVRFSAHLNPVNIAEARAAFFAGAEAPPFAYAPLQDAAEVRAALDRLVVPAARPAAGAAVAAAIAETRALVDALDRRDAASFEALAARCDWLPGEGDDADVLPPPSPPVSAEIGADRMFATLRDAVRRRDLPWEVRWDPVLSARVLVDATRRSIRVNPAARFRETDRAGLVAHGIDVHAVRARNGEAQPLRLFATGLPGSLLTEEGLAILAEERVRALSPGFVPRQGLLVRAVRRARDAGFRELWDGLVPLAGAAAAFPIALRVKRGLATPGAPGVYAKDSVYLRGYRRVRAWLDAGGDLERLYVGKVGIDDPVDAWLRAGWVRPGPVPALWSAAA